MSGQAGREASACQASGASNQTFNPPSNVNNEFECGGVRRGLPPYFG